MKRRGKSDVGAKTMLDVLVPGARGAAQRRGRRPSCASVATASREATKPMLATRGRASFLGERSIGHFDPGATSLLPPDPRRLRRAGGTRHDRHRRRSSSSRTRPRSPRVPPTWSARWSATRCPAPGPAAIRRAGSAPTPLAIQAAIEQVWNEAGVAVLVDLGGAEMNAEMAIEMLARRPRGAGADLQRAHRRGCGGRGHRGLGRRPRWRRSAPPPRSWARDRASHRGR